MRKFINTWLLHYVDVIDPQYLMFKQAFKTMLILGAALGVLFFFHLPEGLFLILPALFLGMTFTGSSLAFRFKLSILFGALMSIGVLIFTLLGHWYWIYVTALVALSVLCFSVRQLGKEVMLPAIFLVVVCLFAAQFPGNAMTGLQRSANAEIAFLISLVINFAIFPYRPRRLITRFLESNAKLLNFLINSVFMSYLCGQVDSLRSNHFKQSVNTRFQHVRSLIQLYPDHRHKKRFRVQMVFFGQAVALNNLFSNPTNSGLLITLAEEIDQIRQQLNRCHKERRTSRRDSTIAKLQEMIDAFGARHGEHPDIASFVFIIREIVHALQSLEVADVPAT